MTRQPDALTEAQIADWRAWHTPAQNNPALSVYCAACRDAWPCPVVCLLDDRDARLGLAAQQGALVEAMRNFLAVGDGYDDNDDDGGAYYAARVRLEAALATAERATVNEGTRS